MEYTNEEIQSKVNVLDKLIKDLKYERTALSQRINSLKKQKEEWEKFDKSQTKAF